MPKSKKAAKKAAKKEANRRKKEVNRRKKEDRRLRKVAKNKAKREKKEKQVLRRLKESAKALKKKEEQGFNEEEKKVVPLLRRILVLCIERNEKALTDIQTYYQEHDEMPGIFLDSFVSVVGDHDRNFKASHARKLLKTLEVERDFQIRILKALAKPLLGAWASAAEPLEARTFSKELVFQMESASVRLQDLREETTKVFLMELARVHLQEEIELIGMREVTRKSNVRKHISCQATAALE
ncbi:hypothetical protein TrCOL_g10171 [Triparma columacea]|uniref:Uncharacterized protein n=1 Tax=Triparma columacea TaxID=722753 RepID=A0A9W7GDX6_9STRA|nr:hypothetical protein TrCOL_g10171 [Triparma columacea]